MSGPVIAGITAIATFGGGCFWCLEAVFERLDGVTEVVSGYAGGTAANPTYEQVCSGTTGHAEVVQVHYEPNQVSYADLLAIFFKAHDPTTLDRQGADVGTQYRSIILYADAAERKAAEAARAAAQKNWKDPIVTEIVPLAAFYPAEDYHQDYFDRNRAAGYCRVVIEPKLQKLKLAF
jgi:peptide-methionine (S)-S-oxide reductase